MTSNLSEYLQSLGGKTPQAANVIAIQAVEDPYYFGLFGKLVTEMRNQNPVRVEYYLLRSLRVGESISVSRFCAGRLLNNTLSNLKWGRIYRAYCDGLAYSSASVSFIADSVNIVRAWKTWKTINDSNALVSLVLDELPVGDLINDSYLRFKPAPTVDLNDIYLWILIWQAYCEIRRANRYFGRIKPNLYLTSYSTYIQHGVAARAALQQGIRVFSFGNYQEVFKQLSLEDWVHTKNPDLYSTDFTSQDDQTSKLTLAESALSNRLSGKIDAATAYMKHSAYQLSDETVPHMQGSVVVFLHDFYDSPHIYRNMVFPDFWQWISFTIETLQAENIKFFLKPHPNQIALSDAALSQLLNIYAGVPVLSARLTNTQLVDAGMCCAVTVYGTVAHEMAFLGVPSIACARHPHISFQFCRTARSRDEYRDYLRSAHTFSIDRGIMRHESLVFYYMHNLNLPEDMKVLRERLSAYRIACEESDIEVAKASLRDIQCMDKLVDSFLNPTVTGNV